MKLPTKLFTKTLSTSISIMVVLAIAVLLLIAQFIMFRYSRNAVKDEALRNASYTLNATLQHIDNILLSVEQSAGNIYWDMLPHVSDWERMSTYSRKLVETSPYITGAAIAMKPFFYSEQEKYSMSYFYRTKSGELSIDHSPIIQAETFGNVPYTMQSWFTRPMETGRACWINPVKVTGSEAIISFCLPIFGTEGKPSGVLGVDVSLALLTKVIEAAKPSEHSYAMMMGSDGSFIIHPDSNVLQQNNSRDVKRRVMDVTVKEAGRAMLAGETGYRLIKDGQGTGYLFFKPFSRLAVPGRVEQDLSWSVGLFYPEDDIFGEYKKLLHVVILVSVMGLLLLFVLCRTITHRQLLPLRMLANSAQRIAEGHYDEPIPDSSQQDEIGQLQSHFQQMQQSLAAKVGELHELTESLQERGEVLSQAYEQAKEADRIKMAFLHRMSNHMIAPANSIHTSVMRLLECGQQLEQEEGNRLAEEILRQGATTATLLKNLLDEAEIKQPNKPVEP